MNAGATGATSSGCSCTLDGDRKSDGGGVVLSMAALVTLVVVRRRRARASRKV
jgi:hypothetical protein